MTKESPNSSDQLLQASQNEGLRRKAAFLTALIESLEGEIVACDGEGNLMLFDPDGYGFDTDNLPSPEQWASFFGVYRTDGTQMPLKEIPLYRALMEGSVSGAEIVTQDHDGRSITMVANGRALFDEDGKRFGAVVVMRDISKRKQTESDLEEKEQRLRNLLITMSEGLLQVDADEKILFANDRFCQMCGYTADELIGRRTLDLFFSAPQRKIIENANKERRAGVTGRYELGLSTKSGEILNVLVGGNPVFAPDGSFAGTLAVFTDITERRKIEQQLLHEALHDGLTGLPNRNLFMEHLQQKLKQRTRKKQRFAAVLFMDLDGFKLINDSLGHAVGDVLLKEISERLGSIVRKGDLFARIGGDEFSILMNDLANEDEGVRLVERLQATLAKPFPINDRQIYTSASIGISYGHYGASAEDVVRNADIAMYRAKSSGPGQFQIFDREMHDQAIRRLHVETELRQALDRNQLRVNYQPIVNLTDGGLRGFEALVRWEHPELGWVEPVDFIPIAEQSNLIQGIGKWVLEESCRQMREWQTGIFGAENLRINVNLSIKEFNQPDLAEHVENVLTTTGLEAGSLKLEVTESHLMENTELAVGIMDRLRALGVHLSLDDFGTGYSSLAYLHRLPVNVLKIDRSFISRMLENEQSLETVKTIVRLAHNLRMHVVAEGIETKVQLDQLKRLRCELGQGFFFAKPMPARDASSYIEKSVMLVPGGPGRPPHSRGLDLAA